MMFAVSKGVNHQKNTAMRNFALYLMLLLAVPATAQSGLFGSHSHSHSHAPAEHHHHGSLMHHGPGEHSYTVQVMNSEDFELALRYISKETFDFNRLDVAKQIVRNNWVTARQIAAFCELFTYDYTRVEFAKVAFASCVDKGMYFVVDDTFIYKFSIDEVHEYINSIQW